MRGRVLHCVDAHAEGEPSRIVVGGVLDVPGATMLEKMRHLEREGDELRRLLLFEPRGSAPLSLDIVLPPTRPEADAGFLIMESCTYEGMSGSNTINTATVLLETGILPMTEPVTELVLEAPAGLVRVTADCRDGRCERVTFENVPSFATHLGAPVSVPGLGELLVDVAYGGAFCAFVDAEPLGYAIVPSEARALAELGERIRPAVEEQLEIAHPAEPALGVLSFVVFTAAPRAGGDARNATDRRPRAARPLGDRHRDLGAAGGARGARADRRRRGARQRERHRHALRGADRGPHAGRRRRGDRPRDLGPRLDHRHAPVRARPRRPVPGGLPAAGHVGRGALRLRVLSRADVEAALDPDALVDELAAAFAALSAGEASMPPRAGVEVPGAGTILLMGAHRHGQPSVTAKLVSVFPDHDPAHQAAIVVFDAATGTPTALMDGDAITAARTAAGSRLATRLLAREDADVLAVLGTGVQGDAHLRGAAPRARVGRDPRVGAPRRGRARARRAPRRDRRRRPPRTPCVARASSASPRRPPSPSCAATGSRPARTSTPSASPSQRPRARPRAGARRASSSSSRASPRSRRRPRAAPTSRAPTRTPSSASWSAAPAAARRELTLYKSVGVGLEDDAAAHLALAGAERRGLGRVVEL